MGAILLRKGLDERVDTRSVHVESGRIVCPWHSQIFEVMRSTASYNTASQHVILWWEPQM